MLRVEGREIVNRSHTYLDPEAVPAGDARPVLRPERLAASLAKLLPGSVLVVSDGDLAFLQALLADNRAAGEVCCLDPAFLLGIVFPELEGSSTEEAAKALFLRVEEETPVLADCERKHRILQACLSTAEAREDEEAEPEVEEEGPAEEEEEAVEAPRRKPRPSSGGGRRRRRRPEPMTDEESVWLVACVVAFIAALLYIPSVTTALYLLAAVLFCPWRVLRRGLRQFRLEGWKLAVLGAALCAAAETDPRCRDFLDRLEVLRRGAADSSAAELVWRLLEELELLALCSAMSDGEQRRARLLELMALAEGYEKTGYRGLHRFVLWLRRQAARGDGPVLGSAGSAAVQILSMHKSKGLEYPVVFLCSMGRRFNMADRKETVLVHPRLGLGPKVTDLERRVEYPTLARRGIDLALKRETLSEELRVLYVAMTRAKERLYITAIEKDVDKHLDKLRATLTRPMDPEALSGVAAPIDWLLYAALDDTEGRLRYRVRELETGEGVAEEESIGQEPDPETLRLLDERLRYVYPYRAAENLPSKVTATGLKGRFEPDAEAAPLERAHRRAFRLPDFARAEKPATGTEKGIATHLVLQYMDFARTESLEAVQGEIERLRALRFLSDREAEAVDAEAIVKLFASPLGQRMKAAPGLHREFRFSLLSPAQPLLGEGEDEQVLLQGVVDCYLDEAEGLTVIDYKTDRLATRADCLRRAEEYRPQLTAYALALERICQKTVRECVLYFLSAGEAVGIQVKNEK